MDVVWYGMDHWPYAYHYFHVITSAQPMCSVCYQVRFLLYFIRFFALISPQHAFDDDGRASSLVNTLNYVRMAVVRLDPLNKGTTSTFLGVLGVCSVLLAILAYCYSGLLFDKFYTRLLRLVFSTVSPICFGWSNALLQYYIEDWVIRGKSHVNGLFALIGTVCFLATTVVYIWFTSRPLSVHAGISTVWDTRFYRSLLLWNGLIQHTWTLLAIGSVPLRYFVICLNLAISVRRFVVALQIPFIELKMNLTVITYSMMCVVQTLCYLVCTILDANPMMLVASTASYLVIRFYVTDRIYGLVTRALVKNLNDDKAALFQDFSDDIEPDFEIPDVPPSKMIALVRYVATSNRQDMSEFAMHVAQYSENTGVILECYRVMAIIGCVPSAAWSRILEIERSDCSSADQGLLCALQYEAIKMEQSQDLNDELVRLLDVEKEKVKVALRAFCEGLCDNDTSYATHTLALYAAMCDSYRAKAEWFLRNSPRSHPIASNFAEFLRKYRGKYVEGQFWLQRAEALKSGHFSLISHSSSSFSNSPLVSFGRAGSYGSSNGSSSSEQQHLISEEVVKRIISKAIPLSITLFIGLLLGMLFVSHHKPAYRFIHISVRNYLWTRMIMSSYCMMRFIDTFMATARALGWVNTSSMLSLKDLEVTATELTKKIEPVFSESLNGRSIVEKWSIRRKEKGYSTPAYYTSSVLETYMKVASNITSDHLKYYFRLLTTTHKEYIELNRMVEKQRDDFKATFAALVAKISWRATATCAVLMVLALLSASYYIQREFRRFTDVFLSIDKESIQTFRQQLMPKPVALQPSDSDECALTSEEIELSDDDPIALPISLPDMAEEQEKTSIAEIDMPGVDPIAVRVFVFAILSFTLVHAMLFLGHQGYKMYFVNGVINRAQDNCQVLSTFSTMCEMMANGIASQSGIEVNLSNRKIELPKVRNVLDNEEFETIISDFNRSWNLFIEGQGDVGSCIDLVLNRTVEFVRLFLENETSVSLFTFSLVSFFMKFGLTSGLVVISLVVAFHMKKCMDCFEAFKCVLCLLPSKYFSPIASVLSQFTGDGDSMEDSEFCNPLEVLKHASVAIVAVDHKKRLRDANQSFLSFYLYKKENMLMRDISMLFPDQSNPLAQYIDDCLESRCFLDKQRTFEIETIRSDGRTVPTKSTVCALLRHNKVLFWVIMRDRTIHMKQEAEMLATSEELHSLLNNVLPAPLIPRYVDNNASLLFPVEASTIVVITIANFNEWDANHASFQVMDLSDLFFNRFDRKAKQCTDVTRVRQMNCSYTAVTGVFDPSVNSSQEAFEFATKCLRVVRKRNARTGEAWDLRICIYTLNSLQAGILSRKRAVFDVFTDERLIIDFFVLNCPDSFMVMNDVAAGELDESLPLTEYSVVPDLPSYTLDLSFIQ